MGVERNNNECPPPPSATSRFKFSVFFGFLQFGDGKIGNRKFVVNFSVDVVLILYSAEASLAA